MSRRVLAHGLAACVESPERTVAPTNAPIAPGSAMRRSTVLSTLPMRACDTALGSAPRTNSSSHSSRHSTRHSSSPKKPSAVYQRSRYSPGRRAVARNSRSATDRKRMSARSDSAEIW